MHPATLGDDFLRRRRPQTIGIVLIEIRQNPRLAYLLGRIGPRTNLSEQPLTTAAPTAGDFILVTIDSIVTAVKRKVARPSTS